jgi:hypothetical protein
MPNDVAIKITMGADPELFVKDRATNKYISPHTFLPGTKHKPYTTEYGAVQVDGLAAEFNIKPASSSDHFQFFIEQTIRSLKTYLPPNHSLVVSPTATFDQAYWDNLPEHVKELGCDPDFNAWTSRPNDRPDDGGKPFRTAGGHIHIGWLHGKQMVENPHSPGHMDDCATIVRQLDFMLGIPSLLWDRDSARRKLYGKAGAFRPKPYGVEYRPLSNTWLRNKSLTNYVYHTTFHTVRNLLKGNVDLIEEQVQDRAQRTIDNDDIEYAKSKEFVSILNKLDGNLPKLSNAVEEF